MAEIELLPCPFCGRPARMFSGWDDGGDGWTLIKCTNDHISDSCAFMSAQGLQSTRQSGT